MKIRCALWDVPSDKAVSEWQEVEMKSEPRTSGSIRFVSTKDLDFKILGTGSWSGHMASVFNGDPDEKKMITQIRTNWPDLGNLPGGILFQAGEITSGDGVEEEVVFQEELEEESPSYDNRPIWEICRDRAAQAYADGEKHGSPQIGLPEVALMLKNDTLPTSSSFVRQLALSVLALAAELVKERERKANPVNVRTGYCHLSFDMTSAAYAGAGGHPEKVMRELGITYDGATPQSVPDSWQFWYCRNVPVNLPSFLSLIRDKKGTLYEKWGNG